MSYQMELMHPNWGADRPRHLPFRDPILGSRPMNRRSLNINQVKADFAFSFWFATRQKKVASETQSIGALILRHSADMYARILLDAGCE